MFSRSNTSNQMVDIEEEIESVMGTRDGWFNVDLSETR